MENSRDDETHKFWRCSQLGWGQLAIVLVVAVITAVVGIGEYLMLAKHKITSMPIVPTRHPTVSTTARKDFEPTSSSVTSPNLLPSPTPTASIPIDKRGNLPELNGFPIYPSSIFIRSELGQECDQEQQLKGQEVCHSVIYHWLTTDDFDQVRSWYTKATDASGWHCNGGAGQYTSPRDASVFGNVCNKGNALGSYELAYNAYSMSTEIILAIPVPTGAPK